MDHRRKRRHSNNGLEATSTPFQLPNLVGGGGIGIPPLVGMQNNNNTLNHNNHHHNNVPSVVDKNLPPYWPYNDLITLADRVQEVVPDNDTLAYNTRVERLNWEEISFGSYTADECKNTWTSLQKHVRKYRILKEVVGDVRSYLGTSSNRHVLRHPDMPKQPHNAYLIFALEKRPVVATENPKMNGNDIMRVIGRMYKNLNGVEKEKYDLLASKAREEYKEKLQEFYDSHPEYLPKKSRRNTDNNAVSYNNSHHPPAAPVNHHPHHHHNNANSQAPHHPSAAPSPLITNNAPPQPTAAAPIMDSTTSAAHLMLKRPRTPLQIYTDFEYEREQHQQHSRDRNSFVEECRVRWDLMMDEDKLFWITWAEDEYNSYLEEVKRVMTVHPNYAPDLVKGVLTRQEQMLKERLTGKPTKPPMSAYHLFTKMMSQNQDLKHLDGKVLLTYVSNLWMNCSEEEKQAYKLRVDQLWERYYADLQVYLESLPATQRDGVLMPRGRMKKIKIDPKKAAKKTSRSSENAKDKNRNVKPNKDKKDNNNDVDDVEKDDGISRSSSTSTSLKKKRKKLKKKEPKPPPSNEYEYFKTVSNTAHPSKAWKKLTLEEKQVYKEKLSVEKRNYIALYEQFLKSLSQEELEMLARSHDDSNSTDEEQLEEEEDSEMGCSETDDSS